MPTQTTDLFLLEDLEEEARTSELRKRSRCWRRSLSTRAEGRGFASHEAPARELSVALSRKQGAHHEIVVIGGTGLIGSKLVTTLRNHGHEAVPASPESGVDTLTGKGLSEALTGASVIVDVSNSPTFEDAAVLEFFTTSTRNLLAAEAIAGVGHHVALSIVGTERLSDSGYYRAKLAQEQLIKQSTVPYSIIHATQFFEFATGIADAATVANTVRLAPVLFQPMAADDVANAIAGVAVGSPVNGTIEIAGPQQFRLDELVRRTLDARHDPREVVTDPHAPYFGAELSERTLVPGNDARLGETRFEDWLNHSLTGHYAGSGRDS